MSDDYEQDEPPFDVDDADMNDEGDLGDDICFLCGNDLDEFGDCPECDQ